MIRDAHPGSGIRILIFNPSLILGSKGYRVPDPRSGSATLQNGGTLCLHRARRTVTILRVVEEFTAGEAARALHRKRNPRNRTGKRNKVSTCHMEP
jgi:hypothetical protein